MWTQNAGVNWSGWGYLALPKLTVLQYTAAEKTSALEPVAKAMDSLLNVFKRDAKLQQILLAPSLKGDDKKQIIAELQKHTGGSDKGNVVKNFLETLAENNRLGVLEPVCENFGKLMGAYRGEVELIVTSAAVRLFTRCHRFRTGQGANWPCSHWTTRSSSSWNPQSPSQNTSARARN